jgi:hypothetical protein
MVDLSAFQVLSRHDVRLALGAMLFNTSLVIAAWFGRAYWMHGIEMIVNKLQVSFPCWPSLTRTWYFTALTCLYNAPVKHFCNGDESDVRRSCIEG